MVERKGQAKGQRRWTERNVHSDRGTCQGARRAEPRAAVRCTGSPIACLDTEASETSIDCPDLLRHEQCASPIINCVPV